MAICVLFHDAFFDYALEIFWSEKCAVLLKLLAHRVFLNLQTEQLFSRIRKWVD